jgi:hypothetical protein
MHQQDFIRIGRPQHAVGPFPKAAFDGFLDSRKKIHGDLQIEYLAADERRWTRIKIKQEFCLIRVHQRLSAANKSLLR